MKKDLNEYFPARCKRDFQGHVGNAFTSASMSGELLFLINGFGFDQVMHSKDHIPDRSYQQLAPRLLPTMLFMSVTWVLNAISLCIDSRVLVYHLALGCAASFCTNLFSAYFFIIEESGWPDTHLLACRLRRRFDGIGQLAKASEDALDVASVLHRNDAALVLLIAPAQHRRLVRFVEDATTVLSGLWKMPRPEGQ